MAKVTIYLQDNLRERVRAAGLNVSAVCATALRQALTSTPELPDRCRCGHWENLHLNGDCQGMGKTWDTNCACIQFRRVGDEL